VFHRLKKVLSENYRFGGNPHKNSFLFVIHRFTFLKKNIYFFVCVSTAPIIKICQVRDLGGKVVPWSTEK
jgi:hypothetical protein